MENEFDKKYIPEETLEEVAERYASQFKKVKLFIMDLLKVLNGCKRECIVRKI